MQGDSKPTAEPAPAAEQEPEVRSEEKPAEIPVTEAAEPEVEAEPEPVEEAPKEEPIAAPADDNHKMSPDEIAALFAQMQGDPKPAAEQEPEVRSEEKPAEIPVTEAAEPE